VSRLVAILGLSKSVRTSNEIPVRREAHRSRVSSAGAQSDLGRHNGAKFHSATNGQPAKIGFLRRPGWTIGNGSLAIEFAEQAARAQDQNRRTAPCEIPKRQLWLVSGPILCEAGARTKPQAQKARAERRKADPLAHAVILAASLGLLGLALGSMLSGAPHPNHSTTP
jgi:hypothetical protein